MPPLKSSKRDAFAFALARGVPPDKAALEAGYSSAKKGAALVRSADILERMEEIKEHYERGGSPALGGVIETLLCTAEKALELDSAAGMAAATKALVEAARLKQLLPNRARGAAPAPRRLPHDEILTDEQWMARYGPEAPGR